MSSEKENLAGRALSLFDEHAAEPASEQPSISDEGETFELLEQRTRIATSAEPTSSLYESLSRKADLIDATVRELDDIMDELKAAKALGASFEERERLEMKASVLREQVRGVRRTVRASDLRQFPELAKRIEQSLPVPPLRPSP